MNNKQSGGAGNQKHEFEISATKTVCDPKERAIRLNRAYSVLENSDEVKNLKMEVNKCEQLLL